MAQDPEDIRGVLIQVVGGRVLLPNATVSEVITLSEPEDPEAGPDWLLGRVRWRGWHVPLFSFGVLAGLTRHEPRETARVCVLKALGGQRLMPFIAMLAQGFPHLTSLRADLLEPVDADVAPAPGVLARVRLHEEMALIPDMPALEEMIAAAAGIAVAGNAPA